MASMQPGYYYTDEDALKKYMQDHIEDNPEASTGNCPYCGKFSVVVPNYSGTYYVDAVAMLPGILGVSAVFFCRVEADGTGRKLKSFVDGVDQLKEWKPTEGQNKCTCVREVWMYQGCQCGGD